MGNHRFKLSNTIPNAWFYKHREMTKPTTNHHNKPPSSSTTVAPPPENHHFSQYHNSPKFTHFHHDPTKISSKRSTLNRKTIFKPSPKHTESTLIDQNFLHSPVTTQSAPSESTQSRLNSTIPDIIINVNGAKKIDFNPEMELQLPPIITKPTKNASRNRQQCQSSLSETSTCDKFTTIIDNPPVKQAVCDPSITSVGNLSQMKISIDRNSTPFSVDNASVKTITDKLPTTSETRIWEDFKKDIGNPSVKSPVGNHSVTSVGSLSQMRLPEEKNALSFSVANQSVTTITDKLRTDMVLSDTPLFCSDISISSKKVKEGNQIPSRKSISGVKLRSNSPKLALTKRIVHKSDQNKNLSQSYAVVKSSYNPAKDFMQSMMEMITENKITSSKDLEELLACYLALNSEEYHDLIVKAFEQICFSLPDV